MKEIPQHYHRFGLFELLPQQLDPTLMIPFIWTICTSKIIYKKETFGKPQSWYSMSFREIILKRFQFCEKNVTFWENLSEGHVTSSLQGWKGDQPKDRG